VIVYLAIMSLILGVYVRNVLLFVECPIKCISCLSFNKCSKCKVDLGFELIDMECKCKTGYIEILNTCKESCNYCCHILKVSFGSELKYKVEDGGI
jgi:hypothetical protein